MKDLIINFKVSIKTVTPLMSLKVKKTTTKQQQQQPDQASNKCVHQIKKAWAPHLNS